MARKRAVIDLDASDEDAGVINLDASDDEPRRGSGAAAGTPAPVPRPKAKAPAAAVTVDLCDEDEGGGLVIDLCDETTDAYDGAVDLTADNDQLAKQMQKAFNSNAIDLTAGGDDQFDLLLAYRNGIDRFMRESSPHLHVREIFHNPHSQPGTALYKRFYAAYKKCREKSIKLVFHGTGEENVEAICRSSLDPKKRGCNGQALGKGEYFAEDLLISLPYCKGGRKLLVFAVIMDDSGLRKHTTPGILVCHRTDHHLPLAVITLDTFGGAGSSAGMAAGMPALMNAFGGILPSMLPPGMAQTLRNIMGPPPSTWRPPRPPPRPKAKASAAGGSSRKRKAKSRRASPRKH
jgi:hypothetical protein